MDFSGWLDNWDWIGVPFGTPPRWLVWLLGITGVTGAAVTLVALSSHAVPMHWLIGALVVTGVLNAVMLFESGVPAVVFGSMGTAAGLACVATPLVATSPALALRWLEVAPVAFVLATPLLGRAWCATLFSIEMARTVKTRAAQLRAVLAGEAEGMLVRVEASTEAGVVATRLGVPGEPRVTIALTHIGAEDGRAHRVAAGVHYLLEGAVLEQGPAVSGSYRDTEHEQRTTSVGKATWLGSGDPMRPSLYDGEVRAGTLVLTAGHALVAVVARLIAS